MNYYDNKDFISNSMLGWIKRGPAYFLSKLDKNSESYETKSLENGKLLHSYIEDPSIFVISDVVRPGEKTALFIEEYAITGDVNKAKEHSGLSYKPETLLASLEKPDNAAYLEFLMDSQGKTCLTKDQGYKIQNAISALHSHSLADSLLFPDSLQTNFETFNELEIYFDFEDNKCKSKLDKVNIDHSKKEITILDLKTTASSPYGEMFLDKQYKEKSVSVPLYVQCKATNWFKSFISYSYYRQAAFYIRAVTNKFKELIEKGYTVDFLFVVVELGNTFDVAVYRPRQYFVDCGYWEMSSLLNMHKLFVHTKFKADETISII